MLPVINFRPDVIHCHDWQTGLVPVYLHDSFQQNEFFWGIKSIMTIHNLKFQGVWDVKTVQGITGLSDYYFAPDKLEAYKDANFLKGGIVFADAVTTVSNTYAEEIKTPFYGERLDGLLCARSHDLRGIVKELIMTYLIRRQIHALLRIIMPRPSAKKRLRTNFSSREISD